jgi:uncharacterized protein (TIGR03435 family)
MPWIFAALLLQLPSFEVASIKPTPGPARAAGVVQTFPGGRVTFQASTVEYLVEQAFGVQRFQVSGGPEWIYRDGFDIEAKPPSALADATNRGVTLNEIQRQMLLELLEDRFQLKYRRESSEGIVYSLARRSGSIKLRDAKNKDAMPWISGPENGIAGGNVSMRLMAARLSRWLDHPVLDRTELNGAYDFDAPFDAPDAGADPTAAIQPSLAKLGLKLERGRGRVDAVIIDSAERPKEF